jgi:hypothetical protein
MMLTNEDVPEHVPEHVLEYVNRDFQRSGK